MIKKKKKKKLIFIKRSIKIGQRKKDKRNLKINFPDYKPLSYVAYHYSMGCAGKAARRERRA